MKGEFDYDESVDVFLNVEGATPVAMRGVSLARAIQAVVDQWSPPQEGSVLINRDGSDITSYDEVLAIYNRDDFPPNRRRLAARVQQTASVRVWRLRSNRPRPRGRRR